MSIESERKISNVATEKAAVQDFWNAASCGEQLYLAESTRAGYEAQARRRYELEPYILGFAPASECAGKDVLEIGVGLGADHELLARAGANLTGVDLTPRAIEHTQRRLQSAELRSILQVADAENLPFSDESFDFVYSWGVLHHSPDTPRAISEVRRVLRPGGRARIMIYHRQSLVGYMLWVRYALLAGRPSMSLDAIYARYLESPGTKAYSIEAGARLFASFSQCQIDTVLTHGDLLESDAGQRHSGLALSTIRVIWPRWFFRKFMPRHGLFMLIRATK